MSRVADALRLANLDTAGADVCTPSGHPWGRDLEPDDATHNGWSTGDNPAGQPARATTTAAGRATEAVRQPTAISPLAELASSERQQIAGLVERVFLPISGTVPRVIAFAGVDRDAGSGWVAAAVADMLAQRTAGRIAVVDVNFANPRLHECFGISRTPGLNEALGSDTPLVAVAWPVRANLSVIPAGEPPHGAELTAGSRARISRLATAFDHVIVSLEPFAGWCGGGLPAVSDGIVLVIAADGTRRETGRKVAQRLQASGAAILGAVLTNRRYAIPEAIYKRL
jgi:Mrp family chromosome partitioning ATPase